MEREQPQPWPAFLLPPYSSRSNIVLSNIKLHSAGLGVLSLRRAPNLGMSCVSRSLMPTSPLEPTSALESPPLFSHPLASAVCPPWGSSRSSTEACSRRGSSPTRTSQSCWRTTSSTRSPPPSPRCASLMHPGPTSTPARYLTSLTPPYLGGSVPTSRMDLRMEVFVTDTGVSSSYSTAR